MIKKQKTRMISLSLSLVFLLSSLNLAFAQEATPKRTELPANFGMPSTFPNIGEHPRVYMRKQNFEDIKLNMRNEEGKYAVKELNKLLANDTDGVLPDKLTASGSNMDYKVFAIVEAYAFDYAVNGNQINGIKAVKAMKNIIATFKYNTKIGIARRELGVVILLSAMVYDWCYPLMTPEDKKLFTDNVETLAKNISNCQWPLSKIHAVHGHNNETHILRDLLAFAIACYDEYPDFYNHVGGYVMNGLVDAKNWWYRSHSFHQGSGYFLRFGSELSSEFLFRRMNGTKLYSDDMGQVPYMFFYNHRPDGRTIAEGDLKGDAIGKIPTNTRGDILFLLYASSLWEDGYLKAEYKRSSKDYKYFSYNSKSNSSWPLLTPTNFLIVNDPEVKPLPKNGLPKTKLFGSPNGTMVARTGLSDGVESNDVIAWAKIGETYAGNHAHLDSGSFQIYYKGPLALDLGKYDKYGSEHDANYSKETIAHNSLLIYDPNEVMISKTNLPVPKNSGGQQRRGPSTDTLEQLAGPDCYMGDVLGMEAGEDPINPEYSYISGDIAPGYSDKVSEVRRSMLFMPTGREDKPAIFVVMDKVMSANPDFKKTFLLHSLQEPEVDGNVTTIKRDTNGYNGKLTTQTLYPQNPQITKVGGFGKQFWVVDKNMPPKIGDYDSNTSNEHGWGRVEISPSVPAKEDYFLNVMYVSDADNLSPVDRADLIETNELLGARIFDKVTLFGKNRERVNTDLTFTVPGEGSIAVSVAGIAKGEWKITGADGSTQTKIATEEGGIIYFEGTAGAYTMQLTNSEALRP